MQRSPHNPGARTKQKQGKQKKLKHSARYLFANPIQQTREVVAAACSVPPALPERSCVGDQSVRPSKLHAYVLVPRPLEDVRDIVPVAGRGPKCQMASASRTKRHAPRQCGCGSEMRGVGRLRASSAHREEVFGEC